MTLSQGHDTIVWYIIKIQYGSEELWLRHAFGCMCALWPWSWRQDLRSRSWHTLGSWTTIVWNIIQIKHCSRSYGPDDFGYVCTVTFTLEIWPWDKVMTYPWVKNNKCVKYYQEPTLQCRCTVQTWIFGIWALWPWHLRYDLESRLWLTLGHGQQLCEILSRSNMAVRSYGPDTDFGYVCTVTLRLEIMTLGQVHDRPLGQGQ